VLLAPDLRLRLFTAHRTLFDIIAFLVEEVFGETDEAGDTPLLRVRIAIESRYREELSLAELADLAHLNPSYLSRSFKRAFGLPPISYQQHLRIGKARQLLVGTRMRVTDIAHFVGFRSLHYFSRVFHRLVGLAPTAYRESCHLRSTGESQPALP
jgi:AraC-like DNA-binding protein